MIEASRPQPKPMRFCMVTTFYPPYNFGGDGICVYRLANELAARGHKVDVIHCVDAYHALAPNEPTGVFPNHPNVTVHSLRSRVRLLSPLLTQQTGYPFFKVSKIRRIFDEGAFDVIHFHNISLVGGPKILELGDAPIKLYTMHEHWLVCPLHVLWKFDREVCTKKTCTICTLAAHRPPQLWRYTGMLQPELKHIDRFIAPSRFTRDIHHQQLSADLPIEHIPHFLPKVGQAFDESRDDDPSVAPPHGRPYFLFVGRLEKIKGIQTLIRVFRNYTKADLLIAGDGTYGPELRELAAGVPNIHFLGRKGLGELRSLYRGAVAALVSSICYEVFGIVVIEAFSMATPVIAHDLGALPEVIEESGGGFVYSTDDELTTAMETLQSNPQERQERGKKGYEAFQRFWTPEAHIEHYFALISQIAQQKNLDLPIPGKEFLPNKVSLPSSVGPAAAMV